MEEKVMEFSEWLQAVRAKHGYDLRAFSERTQTDASTINRIENERAQPLFSTVLHICHGMDVSLVDLLQALLERPFPHLVDMPSDQNAVMPTLRDIESFLLSMHLNVFACYQWLAEELNRIASHPFFSSQDKHDVHAPEFVSEVIQLLLGRSPLYRSELLYPEEIHPDMIWDIYRHQGVLTLLDVGCYLKRVRSAQRLTLANLGKRTGLSVSVLSHMEAGMIERLRFHDVLRLDEHLQQDGRILALFWSVLHMHEYLLERSSGSSERSKSLLIFVTVCRWFHVLYQQDEWWRRHLREGLSRLSQSEVSHEHCR
jgi:transcriptional regulator with XRE-family HTH domain